MKLMLENSEENNCHCFSTIDDFLNEESLEVGNKWLLHLGDFRSYNNFPYLSDL